MKKPVYFDYNAATPVDPRVLEAMLPFLKEDFGNPSSVNHSYGWDADNACKKARGQVAALLGSEQKEVYFTSGATESNNLVIQGVTRLHGLKNEKVHIVTTAVEHKAVIDVALQMKTNGAEVTILDVGADGRVSVDAVKKALLPHTRLVSVIHGNNEVGSINPIAQIGELCRSHNILFHTDAAQTLGKVPVDLKFIDMLSSSGQKMYAPKGVGLLYVREAIRDRVAPILFGGSQERALRPGTLNVPAIVGIGEACRIFGQEMKTECARLSKMRNRLIESALGMSKAIRLNGHPTERLCNNISLSIEGLSSDLFALGLGGVAVSSASACSGGAPSHVLKAMGHSDALARSTLRIGLGRMTTDSDVDLFLEKLSGLLKMNESFQ